MNWWLAVTALYLAAAADTVVAPRLDWHGAGPQFCLTVALLWCLRQPAPLGIPTVCGLGFLAELCGGGAPGGCVLGLACAVALAPRGRGRQWFTPAASQLALVPLGVGLAVAIERAWTWGLEPALPGGGLVERVALATLGAAAWSIPLAWLARRPGSPTDATTSH